MLTALKRGSATVTVATPYYTAPVSATIVVDGGVSPEENLLTEQLARPLSAAIIYSRNVRLARNSVLQSFDIDSGGDIFYIQIAGTDAHSLNVLRGVIPHSLLERHCSFIQSTACCFPSSVNGKVAEIF